MCVKLCNNTTSMCFNDVLWCIQLFGLYGLIKESKPMWLSSDWTFEICIPDIHQLFMVSYIVHNIYIYISYNIIYTYTAWWFQPLWKILVSWGDYSQYMEKIKNVPNHQPDFSHDRTSTFCFRFRRASE